LATGTNRGSASCPGICVAFGEVRLRMSLLTKGPTTARTCAPLPRAGVIAKLHGRVCMGFAQDHGVFTERENRTGVVVVGRMKL
jgi:hypothetical protein